MPSPKPRSEKPCGTYNHPHMGQPCRCIKICANCGWSPQAHEGKFTRTDLNNTLDNLVAQGFLEKLDDGTFKPTQKRRETVELEAKYNDATPYQTKRMS